jgi:hypothetical protein
MVSQLGRGVRERAMKAELARLDKLGPSSNNDPDAFAGLPQIGVWRSCRERCCRLPERHSNWPAADLEETDHEGFSLDWRASTSSARAATTIRTPLLDFLRSECLRSECQSRCGDALCDSHPIVEWRNGTWSAN